MPSKALTQTAGVPDVARMILRHMVGALRTGGAALAVPGSAVKPFGIVGHTWRRARRDGRARRGDQWKRVN